MIDPRTPVIVGVAQSNERDGNAEPIDCMTRTTLAALVDTGSTRLHDRVQAVRVVGGIWPYLDPGSFVAAGAGFGSVATARTVIGGNEVYDLLASTANDITAGSLDVAVICSAETLRTRRRDRAEGRDSHFVDEEPDAAPDRFYGVDKPMLSDAERAVGVSSAVAFYAMAETALRHEHGRTPDEHLREIARLWAVGSEVASGNPSAWFGDAKSADEIAEVGPRNRMVSSPYPKLMTSNIDVDQSAAVVICSAEAAEAAGVPRDRWIFPWSGAGAADHWELGRRWALHESPAMRLSGRTALDLAGVAVDEVDMIDLYSCFPAAVQVAQRELGIDASRPFTITGGLTFFGGPLNSYCLHALARSVELLRVQGGRAFLTGNGGFFTKHSAAVLGSTPPGRPYTSYRPQSEVDALPSRPIPSGDAAGPGTGVIETGVIETYTVAYAHGGQPEQAVLAVLDDAGARAFANTDDQAMIAALLADDLCGRQVRLQGSAPARRAVFA